MSATYYAPTADAHEWITIDDGTQIRTLEACELDAGEWHTVTADDGSTRRAWDCRRHGLEGS